MAEIKTEDQKRKEKAEAFSNGNTFGLIVKFSIPTIIGMMVNALYTVIDRAFAGHIPGVGDLCIAAITITMPVTILIFAIAMLAGAGGGANISLSLGRGKPLLAEKYIGNGIVMGGVFGIAAAVIFYIFCEPLLIGLNSLKPEDMAIIPYAVTYLRIMLIGAMINTVGFCFNRYILAQGFTMLSMMTNIISVVVNIILAPLFLFVFHWGIAGAAYATAIAQTVAAVWSFSCFLTKRVHLRLRLKNFRPDLKILKGIIFIGVAPMLIQICMATVQVSVNNVLAIYGDENAIAAMGIVLSLVNLLLMPIYGINQGSQPIIGFNYGAKLFHRVKKLLQQAILLSLCVMFVIWALVMIFAGPIAWIFAGTTTQELLNETVIAMRLDFMVIPIAAIQLMTTTYFQTIGHPLKSVAMTLLRQIIIFIPVVIILPRFFGLYSVYASGAVADFLAAVICSVFLIFELKRLDVKIKEREMLLEA